MMSILLEQSTFSQTWTVRGRGGSVLSDFNRPRAQATHVPKAQLQMRIHLSNEYSTVMRSQPDIIKRLLFVVYLNKRVP
jgi:hypothetical protein